jgi:hypothetical protein
MIVKCIDWIKKSGELADEYYRAMTMWVTSRRTKGSAKILVKLASAYERALDMALICLRKLKPSREVEIEIAQTQNYKALILDDIRLLSKIKE